MAESKPDYEWELSKENVQPLKQGRKFTNLTAALQPQSDDQSAKLKEEKQQFEIELRSYTGDDPLDIWNRYILWMEQSYPKGGKTNSFSQLLQQCIGLFKDSERYKNDPRFLDIWIKFSSNFCTNSVEIYDYMYNQKIGTGLAAFYNVWARAVGDQGNSKRADSIYNQGLACQAHPVSWLEARHREFQAYVGYKLASGQMQIDQGDEEETENQRMTLGLLKGHGKSKKVTSVRNTLGKSSGLKGLQASQAPGINKQGAGFKVFCEDSENVSPSLPPQTGEWASVPVRETMNRENEIKPAKWTDCKMRQRSTGATVGTPASRPQPAYKVHEDEHISQPMVTPRKVPETDQVLSARKAGKPVDPLKTLMATETNSLSKPMYAKSLVYTGIEEFSFEELRAMKWQRQKKEREVAEMEARMKQMQEQMEAMQKQMEAKAEAERARVQEQQQQMEAYKQAQQEELAAMIQQRMQLSHESRSQGSTPRDSPSLYSSSKELQHHSVESLTDCQHLSSLPSSVTPNSEAGTGNMGVECSLLQSQIPNPQDNSLRICEHTPSFSGPQSTDPTPDTNSFNPFKTSFRTTPSFSVPQSTDPTPDTDSFNPFKTSFRTTPSFSAPQSTDPTPDTNSFNPFKTSYRTTPGRLTAPSPTVNTREAMKTVQGLFNATLSMDKDLGWARPWKEDEDLDMDPVFSKAPAVVPAVAPFKIFEEEDMKPAPTPQVMLETDENRAPIGFKKPRQRRGLAGILQPAKDIAMEPIDETNTVPSNDICMDENDQVVAADPAIRTYEVPMDCAGTMPHELTFAPGFSSTCNFTELARLASTPFNVGNEPQEHAVSPVNTIKSCGYQGMGESSIMSDIVRGTKVFDETREAKPAPNFTELAHLASTPFNVDAEPRELPDPPVSTIKSYSYQGYQGLGESSIMPKVANENEVFDENTPVAQPANVTGAVPTAASFDGSPPHPPRKSNLSPISECSNEDTNLAGSSIGSSRSQSSSDQLQSIIAHSNASHASNSVSQRDASHAAHFMSQRDASHMSHSVSQRVPPKPVGLDMSLFNQTCHEIDTKNYVPEADEEDLLSQSIAVNPYHDPFDSELLEYFLSNLETPLEALPNYHYCDSDIPELRANSNIQIGNEDYSIIKCLASGAYAKVYMAMCHQDGETKALKVQSPASPWEFYIVNEVHKRVMQMEDSVNVRPSLMTIDNSCFFNNGSVFVSEFRPKGTLLELVNAEKMAGRELKETMAVFLIIEMLRISENLIKAGIIHGDIKPDNYLFLGFPDMQPDPAELFRGENHALQLIDFGRGIDMHVFPKGTTFTVAVTTSSFQCIEMMTNRPWTYQTDMFGLVGTMHVLLFGDYMKVYQTKGRWKMTSTFKRWHNARKIFMDIFDELLNIPSCDELPDLSAMRHRLQSLFLSTLCKNYKVEGK